MTRRARHELSMILSRVKNHFVAACKREENDERSIGQRSCLLTAASIRNSFFEGQLNCASRFCSRKPKAAERWQNAKA